MAQDISDLYGAGNRAPERNATRNTDLDSAFGSLTTPQRNAPNTSSSPSSSSREESAEPSAQKKGSSSKSSREASAKIAAEGRAAAAAADDELMSWDKPVVRRQLQLTRVVPVAAASASGRGVGRAAAAERQRARSDEDDDDGEEAEQDDDDGDGGRDVQRRRGAGAKGAMNRQASAGEAACAGAFHEYFVNQRLMRSALDSALNCTALHRPALPMGFALVDLERKWVKCGSAISTDCCRELGAKLSQASLKSM